MSPIFRTGQVLALLLVLLSATLQLTAQPAKYGPHVWDKPVDPATFEKRVNEQIDLAKKSVDQLLAVKGPRTVENTLVPYDNAVRALDTAAYQSGLMQIVNPDAAIRDKAQAMVQKVSTVATQFALNQALYKAMAAIDISKADQATKYYVQRTLLEFKLAGVDKDDATRARVQALNDEITKYASQFSRNLQESRLTVVVKDPKELDGLPEDYIKSHKPGADGSITLTSDSPDVTPVLKFSKSADLRKRIYLAYNNRAYPQNVAVLADLLKKRQELANVLGYKHWADLNAADKMAVNSANVAKFINEIDVASKPAADREYKMLLASAQKQDPTLQADRHAGPQLLLRAAAPQRVRLQLTGGAPVFSVRPRAGRDPRVASKLFHVTFKPATDAPVWDPSVTTFDVFDGASNSDGFISTCIPVRARTSGSARTRYWMARGKQLPEAALVCNFSGGKPGEPGLMEYGEVTTFFHEFGHLMHWIFQGQQQWAGYGDNLESGFRRGTVADAGRMDARSQGAGDVCAELSDE